MKESFRYLSLITQVGLTILFTVFLFTVLGVYLDRLLESGAVFTLLFVLMGCISAMWTAYKLIMKTLPEDTKPK